MWKYILGVFLILPGFITAQYSRVEYFIDTDPGYGMANDVALPQNNECDFVVGLNDISNGFHILYIRVKNENGIWSQTVNRPFLKMALAKDELPAFVKAEYFIDLDPGYGEASSITDIVGDSLMFNADLSGIVEGFHILYVRTQDNRGVWSKTMNRPFIKSSFQSGSFQNIVDAEYFIDSIGDFGAGIPIQIVNPTSNLSADFMIELDGVSLGNHTMYVRAKDSNGAWGMIQSINFNVCPFIQTQETQAICEGDSYVFGSQTLTRSGEYTEVFTSTHGCDSTVVLTLTVNPVYNKTISAIICEGGSYTFGNQTLTRSGEYTEVFTSTHGCDSVVNLNLNVNKIDTTVIVSENKLSSNEVNAEYQWLDCNNGNTPINGAINKSYIPLTNGRFAVEISKNGCTAFSECIPFASTGIANAEKLGKPLKLYPNPSKGEFSIEIVNPMLIEIYNPIGILVFTKHYAIGNHVISFHNAVDGMYLIVAKGKREIFHEKLQIIK